MPNRLNGIWIPESINWEDGSFKILYIRDTSFVQIASNQSKDDKDSIYFMVEPGFNLSAGTIHINDNIAVIYIQDLYKHTPLISDNLPSSVKVDTIYLDEKKNDALMYQEKLYRKTVLFKNESQDKIDSIAINFAQFLKKGKPEE